MNKDNIYAPLLILTLIFCVSFSVYMNFKQQKESMRIEESLSVRFEQWVKSYSSIKQEIDSKTQIKTFLEQEEYNRQLKQFVNAELADFSRQQDMITKQIFQLIEDQKENYTQLFSLLEDKLDIQRKDFLKIQEEVSEGLSQDLSEIGQSMEAIVKDIKENKTRIESLMELLEKHNSRLDDYRAKLQDLSNKQSEYENKLDVIANPINEVLIKEPAG